MTDYMKEAERLADEYAKAVHDGRDSDCVSLRAAVLAHIQRRVPEGWQVVHCTPIEHEGRIVYEHTSEPIPNADGFVLYAAAPDQFRDATKMMAEPAEVPMTQAATDVLAERQRQISAEGWTPEHDDEHDDNSLAAAAACYALGDQAGEIPAGWPQSWDESWWRPSASERRNLVKAGALILAEIERLDRAALRGEECDLPPRGWRCTRVKGHSGPCAAVECPWENEIVERAMARLRGEVKP